MIFYPRQQADAMSSYCEDTHLLQSRLQDEAIEADSAEVRNSQHGASTRYTISQSLVLLLKVHGHFGTVHGCCQLYMSSLCTHDAGAARQYLNYARSCQRQAACLPSLSHSITEILAADLDIRRRIREEAL